MKLPECLEKSPKATKILKKNFKDKGAYPIISQEKGLINGYWDNENDVIYVDRPLVIFGDHTQVVKLVEFNFVVGADGVKLLKPKSFLDARYLYYYLLGNPPKVLGYARHFRLLKELDVVVPPLPEQKRIVAILDDAFAGIATAVANTEKNLANARELFESYLNAVFTETPDNWMERKLGDVCTIKHGFAFKSKYFAANGDYVVLTPGSFFEYGGFRDQGEKTKYYTGDVPEGFILDKDDFLIAMTEQAVGLLGSSLIVPEADLYLHNQRLGRVRVRESFDWHNDFFFHQFDTTRFRDAVQATASGVKVRHTSPTKLEAISVQVPPNKTDQESVANRLNDLLAESRRLERIARQKLTALADLKQSLLGKAFSGELTADKVAPNATLKEEEVA